MPVDPQIGALLAMLSEGGAPALTLGTPEAGRAFLRELSGARTPDQVIPVGSVADRTIPGPAGDIPVRVYVPSGEGSFPVIAFYHGGGWVIGDLETHDQTARELASGARAVVVSVDYRLAPEHPFPAAVDDSVAAARWLADHLGDVGGAGSLSVAGDSAGGNLSAVVAQQLAQDGITLAGQFLIYPATDARGGYPSRVENAEGYFLDQAAIDWFFGHYAGPSPDLTDPRLSPLLGTFTGELPPALIVTAELDPLRDEGEAYGKALEAAGVHADVRRYDGLIHGFFGMGAASEAAQAAITESVAAFGQLIRS